MKAPPSRALSASVMSSKTASLTLPQRLHTRWSCFTAQSYRSGEPSIDTRLMSPAEHSLLRLLYTVAFEMAGYSRLISEKTCSAVMCRSGWLMSRYMACSYFVTSLTFLEFF